uniref:protein-tyrosine-phosphatase n=1 Tax=Lotharella oceanica TaxID=641309 RepID=A0A7S2XBN4_9EUKA|mmetsp:Transcript_26492/g.49525  ORF Transcript_26492/g.49525 Transcript_26492/m.49525 type:complete len:169 (+) Transcript_26492:213-719(+)|eukprot:CAMPEP_0170174980 /NCGR_PEP_ID=MMETSP0040_2-20121228/8144_1 /TAXON_ID=641309 /ORGANISM="Lotharella oceanica, Strain CCMP622" /LENGTH=168 /DNA_ID=CAMNT_0010416821 /DNA_START=141 /DNA_END=647 /DNA_ORIENTATION=+
MTGVMVSQYVSSPSLITYKDQRYLIMDAPTDSNLDQYLKELKKEHVTTLVRTCEPSYSVDKLTAAGIGVKELPFKDGAPPPEKVVEKWLEIVKDVFEKKGDKPTIAIHCVAGLGRAPVCVAIGLIEKGMDPMDAIKKIRSKRRGAINQKQVKFLLDYKRKEDHCCNVM